MKLLTGSLFEAFEERARSQPERLAIQDGAGRLTYGDLLERAQQVAAGLERLNCDRDRPVALLYEPGVEYLIAFMGVLASGGFFVPIDPRSPSARCRAMLEDAGSTVLLTSRRHHARAGTFGRVRSVVAEELKGNGAPFKPGRAGEIRTILR